MATTKKTHYVAEERPAAYDETASPLYPDEQPDLVAEASEPRCAACGELLAWHEEACGPAPIATEGSAPVAAPRNLVLAPSSTFAYDLGQPVQPVPDAPARTIVWRGQLKERHPRTGLVHRVNVYRLNDNFWDCYHEEDLQAA